MATSSLLSRRRFFRHACSGACCGLAAWSAPVAVLAAEGARTALTATQALERLKKGNADFLANRQPPDPPDHSKRRLEIARSQTPFAVLVIDPPSGLNRYTLQVESRTTTEKPVEGVVIVSSGGNADPEMIERALARPEMVL